MVIMGLAVILLAILLIGVSKSAVKSDREFISHLSAEDRRAPRHHNLSSLVHRDDE